MAYVGRILSQRDTFVQYSFFSDVAQHRIQGSEIKLYGSPDDLKKKLSRARKNLNIS